MKFIDQIPKPLLEDFLCGRVIPFVGAGFSKNADIPTDITMPDWKELGKLAANSIPGYSFDGNSIDALSYFEELYSRSKLVEFIIKNTGGGKISPGKAYESLCKLFTGTICTTNFDQLIEKELTLLKMPFTTIVTEDRLSVISGNECRVIKVHGDYDHPNKMVITERDYDRYLVENPIMATYIANLFIGNTMLLVGYSLDDNDLRGILQIILERLDKMTLPIYCITLNATQDKIDRYKRRNIKVINFDNKKITYKELFIGLFDEIREYLENQRNSKITSSDDSINAQFAIPSSDNMLCYLSCSAKKIPLLSKNIRSILRAADMMLVEPNDVLPLGENVVDTITTLIGKCNMAIIDITEYSPYQDYEIRRLVQSASTKPVIFICEENYDERYINYIADSETVLKYGNDGALDEVFSEALLNSLKRMKGQESYSNANKLFNLQEYSACVAMAYAELESRTMKLRKKLEITAYSNDNYTEHRRYYSLGSFISYALNLTSNELEEFRILQRTRNRVVHENLMVSKKEAQKCLTIANKLLDKVEKYQG